jgi:cytochrome c556
MIRATSAAALLAVGASLFAVPMVSAQNTDAIKARKEVLKSFGNAAKEPGAMFKGEAPFELAKVKAALKTYQEGAGKLPTLFPANSKTGGDTEALPVIWEGDKNKDFLGRFPKLAADAKAAETSIKDEASFKTVWPKLMGDNCSGCHKIYRKPK